MKRILSASRRTDIPAFYYGWLQSILQAGEVILPNPRFPEKTYRVIVRPDEVHSLVLWSKDYTHVAHEPGYLQNYNLYFQYTINQYTKYLEPNVPPYQETLNVLEKMLKRYRPEQFNIRFDPVIISCEGELCPTPDKPGKARLLAFERLCRDLQMLGMQSCRISTSYVALYSHVRARLTKAGFRFYELRDEHLGLFFMRMVEIAQKYGFQLFSCASPLLEQIDGINKGRCVDGDLLDRLFGEKASRTKDSGQRLACGCTKSADIGSYLQPCSFSCVYCYSNRTL